jgi:DNA-binding MarR family transcriptional regulator
MNQFDPAKRDDLQLVMAAGRSIYAAMDRLDSIMSDELSVNRTDLRCLLHLIDNGGSTPGDIATTTGLTSGSVTALIDRLERQGLAERRPGCPDRRTVTIEIPAGERQRVERAIERLEAAILGEFAALEGEQLALVAAALPLFATVLQRGADRIATSGLE